MLIYKSIYVFVLFNSSEFFFCFCFFVYDNNAAAKLKLLTEEILGQLLSIGYSPPAIYPTNAGSFLQIGISHIACSQYSN